jgi:hypothetical protein
MTRELAGVYAVLRRTITTTEVAITTTKLCRGAGGLLLGAAAGAAGAGGGKIAGGKALLSMAFDLDRHALAPCAHFLATPSPPAPTVPVLARASTGTSAPSPTRRCRTMRARLLHPQSTTCGGQGVPSSTKAAAPSDIRLQTWPRRGERET